MFRVSSIFHRILLCVSFGVVLYPPLLYGQRPTPEVYKILGITVEGNSPESGTESSAIIANSGLKVGAEITIPGDQAHQAVLKLWALRIFSDIQILVDHKSQGGIYLLIKVKEYPRLSACSSRAMTTSARTTSRRKTTSQRARS